MIRSIVTSDSRFNCVNALTIKRFNVAKPFRFGFVALTCLVASSDVFGESPSAHPEHAHNPVDWYPWGEDAFAKARHENKPIFLSVGYSTCHWCHVMAHE